MTPSAREARRVLLVSLPALAIGAGAGAPRASAIAAWALGAAGLVCVHAVVRDLVPERLALWTAAALLYATLLLRVAALDPSASAAAAFALSAAALLAWWRARPVPGARAAVLAGAFIGVAAALRREEAALLALPLAPLVLAARDVGRRAAVAAALVLGGFAAGMLVPAALDLAGSSPGAPSRTVLETLFSSRRGLLFGNPILWGGLLGLVSLARREGRTAAGLAITVVLMIVAHAGSVSAAAFAGVLPLLAVGLALAFAWLAAAAARRPGGVLAAAGLGFTLWNLLFMEQYRRNFLPRDDTVSFAQVAENNARLLAGFTGTPLAWPANWLFALRHGLPAERYDVVAGRDVLAGGSGLGGVLDLGDPRVDPALLDGEWGPRTDCGGTVCRAVTGRARVLAPLGRPEPLEVVVRARGSGRLRVELNDAALADLPLADTFLDLRVHAPEALSRRGLNLIALTSDARAEVDLLRLERRPSAPVAE